MKHDELLRLKTQVIGHIQFVVSESVISEIHVCALDGLSDQTVIPFRNGHKASQQLISPLDRNPRLFPFGILLVESRLFNGIDGFSWFVTEAAAVDYLRNAVWQDLKYDSEDECIGRSLFRYAFRNTSLFSWDSLNHIHAEQDELQVVWFGIFNDLCTGNDNFAEAVVKDFQIANNYSSNHHNDRFEDEFILYLQSYRSLVPAIKR